MNDLLQRIEEARSSMHQLALQYGFNTPLVLEQSQRLDRLLNIYHESVKKRIRQEGKMLMETCPYCHVALVFDADQYYCTFCQMTVVSIDVPIDGSQEPLVLDSFFFADYAELSTPELMKKSTFFFVFLLRLVQQERRNIYNQVRLFNKVTDSETNEYLEASQESGKTYEWWTRKAWVIENILCGRMGHFLTRITDQYLSDLIAHMQQPGHKQ
ncbi:aspartyl-phosphate phosphatase Spo0E family protein [Paenibacillus alkaliterrae]|uniref:aspartyl-phosphate phosphatase Spo0E family protein n=1 Tax=Paenibacillus alkaliterrae TaxID=320909 RepID=UPI001F4540F6|nr:aspartyl-phosphate phosphatase Spo0E family protein [Paenibacillus alkaliterrae]MCF2940840.1 aspartyl-phosphate phosphatase Spo0E family protein [Paenibacillus alkaliterrae]